MSKKWTFDDIEWERFDPSRVNPELLKIARAASMVEYRSADYVAYLCNVFSDDEAFKDAAHEWGEEEIQHGMALARWARMADPSFDFEAAFADFRANFRLKLDSRESIRGTRTAELLSRCMVEIGTSSFYSSIRDSTDEPVLRQICDMIARDEFAHYGLFRRHMERYLDTEPLGFWSRVRTLVGRALETTDDELAYAYYAANRLPGPYDRKLASDAYAAKALALYQPSHVKRGVVMMLKALGIQREGWLTHGIAAVVFRLLRWRSRWLAYATA